MSTNAIAASVPAISVCVCTYKRPQQLKRLLQCLDQQSTGGLFKFTIVVLDNDADQSAKGVVEEWAEQTSVSIVYGVEPRQSIALARNAAVALGTGGFIAFVDDDEEPTGDWLLKLYEVLAAHGADGVIGQVIPQFAEDAPEWALKSDLFQRPAFRTGEIVPWKATATNNALVKREVLAEFDGPFRPQFGAGGEDQDLFRRAMSHGRVFVWSAEAVCYEPVPPERTRLAFQLRRALLRGRVALNGPEGSRFGILKSIVAVPLYVVSLPLCLPMGSHVFIAQLVRSFDHLGKLLAACGINPVRERYIS